MPTLGVTGHVVVADNIRPWLVCELNDRLASAVATGWHGVTCLATGADQLFASAVAEAGGRYDVILPASDYGSRQRIAGHAEPFRRLLNDAARIDLMPYRTSSRIAYLAASEAMLARCDLLLAVWDGRRSRAIGDTADVVARAHVRGVPVERLWPMPELPTVPFAIQAVQAMQVLGTSPVTSQLRTFD